MSDAVIDVSVAWITAHVQDIVHLRVPADTTVAQAIEASGLLQAHGLDRNALTAGVFGRRRRPEALVRAGDRIELLRPLIAEPKEARRHRAALQHEETKPDRAPRR
ncbi:MAG: RnfH family protein [Pseudomonadota bacterium]|nr:RnfH family protein [Pseudomonadota bacterium]